MPRQMRAVPLIWAGCAPVPSRKRRTSAATSAGARPARSPVKRAIVGAKASHCVRISSGVKPSTAAIRLLAWSIAWLRATQNCSSSTCIGSRSSSQSRSS